jgi:hypothetical protein
MSVSLNYICHVKGSTQTEEVGEESSERIFGCKSDEVIIQCRKSSNTEIRNTFSLPHITRMRCEMRRTRSTNGEIRMT